ncbi:MAG: TMEM43 family protein [Oligoflexales bacterium]
MASRRRQDPRMQPPRQKKNAIPSDDQYLLLSGSGITLGIIIICFIWWSEKNYGNFHQLSKVLRNDVMAGKSQPKKSQEGFNLLISAKFKLVENLNDPYLARKKYLFLVRNEERKLLGRARLRNKNKSVIKSYTLAHKKLLFGSFRGKEVYNTLVKTYLKENLTLSRELLKNRRLPIIGNKILVGADIGNEKKISYQYIPRQTFTIVAKQRKGRLIPIPLLKKWDNKFLIVPGKKTLREVANHFVRKNKFYSYIFRVYGLGFMWFAFCLFFIPFQGNFKSWSFLSSFTRILPLIFALPTTILAISTSNSNPDLRSLGIQTGSFLFFLLFFIYRNRSLATEKRESIDFYGPN